MNECTICRTGIPFRNGRGRQPKTCSSACKEKQLNISSIKHKSKLDNCSVEGCKNLANRTGFGLCEKHYYRQRRNGSLDLKALGNPEDVPHTAGYILRRAKDHPMSAGQSRAYVHRVVYYDAHGEGPFNCKWCSKTVTWNDLHIDHLNDDKKDNRLENLAAACCGCNTGRGIWKRKENLAQKQGFELNGEVRTLNSWAEKLGISRSSIVLRLKNGWPIEKALSQPRGRSGPKKSA